MKLFDLIFTINDEFLSFMGPIDTRKLRKEL